MANSLLSLLWELISRMITTFLLYGVSESVSRKITVKLYIRNLSGH